MDLDPEQGHGGDEHSGEDRAQDQKRQVLAGQGVAHPERGHPVELGGPQSSLLDERQGGKCDRQMLGEEDQHPRRIEGGLRRGRLDHGAGLDGVGANQELGVGGLEALQLSQLLLLCSRRDQRRRHLFRLGLGSGDHVDQRLPVQLVEGETGEQGDVAGEHRVDLAVDHRELRVLSSPQGLHRIGRCHHDEIDLAPGQLTGRRGLVVGDPCRLDAATESLVELVEICRDRRVLLVFDDEEGFEGLRGLPIPEPEQKQDEERPQDQRRHQPGLAPHRHQLLPHEGHAPDEATGEPLAGHRTGSSGLASSASSSSCLTNSTKTSS